MQFAKLHDQVEELGHPDFDALPAGEVFGKTMTFNVLPRIDAFAADGSAGEEVKTIQESRKILGIADLDVAATCDRVLVPGCCSCAGHLRKGAALTGIQIAERLFSTQ